jgi:energy-coupling factor transporter ATP-binding protein EcfA2
VANRVDERGVPLPPDEDARDPVVTVSSLIKRYGELVAVNDLTFSLSKGTVTGFLGPNGAGKTTTLRLLLGLAEPTAGQALVFGRRYRELDDPARRVGAVLETSDCPPRTLRARPLTRARARGGAPGEPRRGGAGVVGQFESRSPAISSVQTRSATPAAIAGVVG